MISLHMQGGCLCENEPGLRLDTDNVELAALIAPRPLLMVAATGDWTDETPKVEYPAMRRIYALLGAEDRVHSVQFQAPHNYNKNSREAVYSWMARWLQHAPADVAVAERPFTPEKLPDLLVFLGRPLPDGARTEAQLVDDWIAAARRQLHDADPKIVQSALLHALSMERRPSRDAASSKIVVTAGVEPDVDASLRRAGFTVRPVRVTPYDADAAAKIAHFDTYNRTAASQRVADLVQAIDENPGAAIVAGGDFGLPALLAAAVAPVARAVVDVGRFDNGSDQAFIERVFISGLRRAGDFQTAMAMTRGRVVIHNAADRFTLDGANVERGKLTPDQIAARLR